MHPRRGFGVERVLSLWGYNPVCKVPLVILHGGVSPESPAGPLGPLGHECAQHRQILRPSVDGIRSKALRPFGLQ